MDGRNCVIYKFGVMHMKKDYCSYSPDSIFGVYIGSACKQHDEEYWKGNVTRLKADWNLFLNIINTRWFLFPIGIIYFLMVRIFGGKRYGKK